MLGGRYFQLSFCNGFKSHRGTFTQRVDSPAFPIQLHLSSSLPLKYFFKASFVGLLGNIPGTDVGLDGTVVQQHLNFVVGPGFYTGLSLEIV